MKTIRNQRKHPIRLRLPVFLKMEELSVFNFYAVTKRTTNRQQTKKNQLNFARKRFRSLETVLWPSKHVQLHFLRRQIMDYVTSL